MRAIPWLALCAVVSFEANAVEFAVPIEAAGITPSVKSIRVSCTTFSPMTGVMMAQGFQFVSVVAGAVKQTVTVKLDIPPEKALPNSGYQCEADRAFELDVTKMSPVSSRYTKPAHLMTDGLPMKDLNLQATSVPKVGGKL